MNRLFRKQKMLTGYSLLAWIVSATAAVTLKAEEPVRPQPHAHAHNDYAHRRPLLDALERGFCSVEADIFLVDDQLLVGHTRAELEKGRTLEKLYLDPLRKLADKHGGRIGPDYPEFWLWIDVKSEATATIRRLSEVLSGYREILTEFTSGEERQRAVRVIVSGNRDWDLLAALPVKLAGIDGRTDDLGSELEADLLPAVSEAWHSLFKWRGQGAMPSAELQKLKSLVQKAHARNRRIRFWATPENTNVWQQLLDCDVDLINTDQLDRLQEFLLEQP